MAGTLKAFWADESGVLVSAELVTIATLGVVGLTAGLSTVATSLNAELNDVSRAIRSLNQSYSFSGFTGCRAYTAGSSYTQMPVDQAIISLCIGEPAGPEVTFGPTDGAAAPEHGTPEQTVVTPADDKIPAPAVQ